MRFTHFNWYLQDSRWKTTQNSKNKMPMQSLNSVNLLKTEIGWKCCEMKSAGGWHFADFSPNFQFGWVVY